MALELQTILAQWQYLGLLLYVHGRKKLEHATIFYVQATIFYVLMYCFNNLKKKSKFEFRNKQVH